jgi:hypothetical protein
MPGFRVQIKPVDAGATTSSSELKRGVATPSGQPQEVVINASEAQIQGVMNYLKLIKAGATTTTVETAITALTP